MTYHFRSNAGYFASPASTTIFSCMHSVDQVSICEELWFYPCSETGYTVEQLILPLNAFHKTDQVKHGVLPEKGIQFLLEIKLKLLTTIHWGSFSQNLFYFFEKWNCWPLIIIFPVWLTCYSDRIIVSWKNVSQPNESLFAPFLCAPIYVYFM